MPTFPDLFDQAVRDRVRLNKFSRKDYAAATVYLRNVVKKVARENGPAWSAWLEASQYSTQAGVNILAKRGLEIVEEGLGDPAFGETGEGGGNVPEKSPKVKALLDALDGILPIIEYGLEQAERDIEGSADEAYKWRVAAAEFDKALLDLAE